MTKDTTLTPLWIIRALGEFDMDPCGYAGHPTANMVSCLPVDGLSIDWSGRVWLNPPYSDPEPFIKKLSRHGNGIALVLSSTETKWFQDYVLRTCSGILFMKGRPKFLKPVDHGFLDVGLMRATCLVAYGAANLLFLRKSGIHGHIFTHDTSINP